MSTTCSNAACLIPKNLMPEHGYYIRSGNTEKLAKAIAEAVGVQAEIAKCSNLEPEEAAMLYRILYKMLGKEHLK